MPLAGAGQLPFVDGNFTAMMTSDNRRYRKFALFIRREQAVGWGISRPYGSRDVLGTWEVAQRCAVAPPLREPPSGFCMVRRATRQVLELSYDDGPTFCQHRADAWHLAVRLSRVIANFDTRYRIIRSLQTLTSMPRDLTSEQAHVESRHFRILASGSNRNAAGPSAGYCRPSPGNHGM